MRYLWVYMLAAAIALSSLPAIRSNLFKLSFTSIPAILQQRALSSIKLFSSSSSSFFFTKLDQIQGQGPIQQQQQQIPHLNERPYHSSQEQMSTGTDPDSVSSMPAETVEKSTSGSSEEPGKSCPPTEKLSQEGKTERAPAVEKTEAKLPPLSAADFRIYNRNAEVMNAYHNHFRHTWNTLYTACTTNSRPTGMSIRSFLNLGFQFVSHLTTHHGIEESYIFPQLATKMPKFRDQDHLKSQHAAIHRGLDVFEKYLRECQRGERELRLEELGKVMATFGEVLWQHLDDEVKELGAENMRKYWTKQEMNAMVW